MVEDFDNSWATPMLTLFYISGFINLFYACSRWANLINAIRSTKWFSDKPLEKAGKIRRGEEPHVTIQICTYNEGLVVKETINRACSVDWPKHKLTVHVLDDSTDKNSSDVVESAVKAWRADGMDISRLSRPHRTGYKAGSLRYHFQSVESEFVAHFVSPFLIFPVGLTLLNSSCFPGR